MKKRELIFGGRYQHFKGMEYVVLNIVTHSETGELMVLYCTNYGDRKYYVRPYDMFISKVDKEKYPEVEQEYRFEWIKD